MAQAWRSLGSQITLIEAADRLLAREEPFAERATSSRPCASTAWTSRKGAQGDGGALRGRRGGRRARLGRLAFPGTSCSSRSAAGPTRPTSGVETIGLEPGKPIEVDDQMRAPGSDWLYAIGDVNGRALLTHMGKYQARIAADTILGPGGPCLHPRRGARPARDVHRPAGGRGRLHARRPRRGRAQRASGRRRRPRRAPARASTAATTRAAPRGSSSTTTPACWWARPSPARRSPSGCRPRPIAVVGEVPLSGSPTPCRPSRRAARSGST